MTTFTNFNSTLNATNAMKNYVITTSERLKNDENYQKICTLIYKLIEGGITFVGKGYCISMSDIVYTLLKQHNIPCKIVECHLTITNIVNDQLYVMGFDGLKDDPNKSDTHVVVVTETEIPLIIDVSIAHLLPNNIQGIIDELVEDNQGIFANITHSMVRLTYQKKNKYSIPMLHQRSIIDRIKTDVDLYKSIKFLKVLIILALTVSFLNASRGFYDFYSVYILDNYWGPNAIKLITEKVNELHDKIDGIK